MPVSFVRQLGAESGVQLNPLRDNSEIPSTDNSDQVFGIIMRATRGRIDKPFKVDRGTVYTKLGKGEGMRVNALNEAWVQVVEALNNGAYEAVVQRLVPESARIQYAVLTRVKDEGEEATTFHWVWTVMNDLPTTPFVLAVKHLGCFNDGIRLNFHAEEVKENGVAVANPELTLRLLDKDDNKLFEFTASLKADAKDDYGQSYYLPDVVQAQTDEVEVTVGVTGEAAVIQPTDAGYGYLPTGLQSWAESGTLVCFEENGTAYTTQIYQKAREALQYCPFDFAYLSAGGTQDPALLAQLALLAFDTNKQLRFDVPGNLTVEAAVAFVEQLNMGASKTAHLMQAFWHPVKSDDPTGINPRGFFGTATLNIAYACGRNAQRNTKGFAPKNYPIAGREWPIARTRMEQVVQLRSQDKNALARAKINPVIYETYTGGGRFVFFDSLTCALVETSLKKLIAVADMSTSIDDAVTRAAKDYLQLPMKAAIDKMNKFLVRLFEGAEASDWIVPAADPMMEGQAFKFDVRANEARPYDTIDVRYWLRYDGTNRATFVTQTITR